MLGVYVKKFGKMCRMKAYIKSIGPSGIALEYAQS